jgi:hypothetical protein
MRNFFRHLSSVWQRVFPACQAIGGAALAACLLAGTAVFSAPPVTPVVPTVNAEVGACSADFVVKDGNQKPLYGAKIEVRFHYGFLNLHKVSLEAYTNADGKARFEGLPEDVKKPLAFRIRYGDRQKTVTDDPGVTCTASKSVVLP